MSSPCDLTAVEQRELIRRGEISATELLEAHLDRIEAVNPTVNAIVSIDPDVGRARARAVDEARAKGEMLGALAGLITAHKDLTDTADFPTSYGSPVYGAEHQPAADSLLVQRMKAAGAVALGKTNTPEFGAGSHTFNPVFGTTTNPWDITRSAGGSSGGAAVALATGMVAVADGSDMGGSLRNPAAWNGVVGFRCSPGVVPRTGTGLAYPALSVEGAMGRTVDDLALLLSVLSVPDRRDPLTAAAAVDATVESIAGELRVAFSPTVGGLAVEEDVASVVDAAAKRIEGELGWPVIETEPDLSGADECFDTLRSWLFAGGPGAELSDEDLSLVKATVQDEIGRGRAMSAAQAGEALGHLNVLYRRSHDFFDDVDLLIAPVTQISPFPIELEVPASVAGRPLNRYIDWMRSVCRVTVMSAPAMSLPVGFTDAGLPVGLQLIARPGDDARLLSVAKRLEPLFASDRRPPVVPAV